MSRNRYYFKDVKTFVFFYLHLSKLKGGQKGPIKLKTQTHKINITPNELVTPFCFYSFRP